MLKRRLKLRGGPHLRPPVQRLLLPAHPRDGNLGVDVGGERAEANICGVIGRLNSLSGMMKDEKIRRALKGLDEDLCKIPCILCPSSG